MVPVEVLKEGLFLFEVDERERVAQVLFAVAEHCERHLANQVEQEVVCLLGGRADTVFGEFGEQVQNGRVQVELPVHFPVDELDDDSTESEAHHQVPSRQSHEFQVF